MFRAGIIYFRGASDILWGDQIFFWGMIYFSGVRILPERSYESGGAINRNERVPIFIPAQNFCSVRPCHNTRNTRKFFKIFMLVPGVSGSFVTFLYPWLPGTSVIIVRPVPQYPGYGYSMFCTCPELL